MSLRVLGNSHLYVEWDSRLEHLYWVELLVPPPFLLSLVKQLSNKDHKVGVYKGIVIAG